MKPSRPLLAIFALVPALSLGLGACADNETPPPASPSNASGTPPTAVATTGSTPGYGIEANTSGPVVNDPSGGAAVVNDHKATAAPTAAAPTEAQSLNDEQILEMVHTADAGEIDQAKLALSKSKDARVKAFAAMMLKEHSDADTKEMACATKAHLKPTQSIASQALDSAARQATTSMRAQSGTAFDKEYVKTQVLEHQNVLDTIDQKLLPAAQNADVKSFLSDVRRAVATHLQHAKDLDKQIQATP